MSKLNHNGVLFLQERHCCIKNENAWVNYFNCPVFFSLGASNACGVLIAYIGKKSFVLTLFFPMFPFDPPENIRKPKVF